jgi:hypothetical protein
VVAAVLDEFIGPAARVFGMPDAALPTVRRDSMGDSERAAKTGVTLFGSRRQQPGSSARSVPIEPADRDKSLQR